ncbi:Digestive cysteine proteinase 2 [Armadillidium vulgare]|nr:Digestive cysteine proteinase 2 [Armadillidium vulgare]
MGINGFADMLLEEASYLKGYNQDYSSSKASYVFDAKKDTPYPDSVDWRLKGLVTPVQSQEGCGCSWAFSATGSLEGQNAAKGVYLLDLSEQNLVDCVGPNDGCSGGKMTDAFDYVRDNHGIDEENDYTYMAKEGTCKFDPRKIGGHCLGYVNITSGSEDDLLAAVATIGPISVAIDTFHMGFLLYRSGVYYNPRCSSDNLDHAALVVGYGAYYGDEYWEVKNSWGPFWGYRGYIRMARNKENNCGIATAASYPLV